MGNALWIVPPPAEASRLKRLMRVPALLDPLPYPIPSFEPHITLASFPSSVPVPTLRSALLAPHGFVSEAPSPLAHLRIAYAALATGDHFFRSVLVDIVPTPALESFRAGVQWAAEQNLGYAVNARSPRFPHLSLFYIPDEHAADRSRVRDALWEAYGVRVGLEGENERIAFDLSGGEQADDLNLKRLAGFDASEIWIVRCEGPVEDWQVLDKVFLHSSS